ncbi:DUF6969 family protein [Pararhodobacter sp.]|uniref:DUF6969 family protein n=1 Tax=Pararhodobacter sp. TaxID=2127056 RepID=UPI003A599461
MVSWSQSQLIHVCDDLQLAGARDSSQSRLEYQPSLPRHGRGEFSSEAPGPSSRNTLIKGGLNVIGEILRGQDAFVEMAHYPADEVFDDGAAGQPRRRAA